MNPNNNFSNNNKNNNKMPKFNMVGFTVSASSD